MIGDVRQHLTQPSFGIDAVQLGRTLQILLQLTDLFAVALALLTKFPAQLPRAPRWPVGRPRTNPQPAQRISLCPKLLDHRNAVDLSVTVNLC